MGCDYAAAAVIGYEIDPKSPFTTQRVKAFKHDLPDEPNQQYDPGSGRKLYVDKKLPIDGYDPDGHPERLGRFDLTSTYEGRQIFVGVSVETESSNGGEESAFGELGNIA